jgi:hypothetical protein
MKFPFSTRRSPAVAAARFLRALLAVAGGFTAGRADDIVTKSGAAPKNISARMAA